MKTKPPAWARVGGADEEKVSGETTPAARSREVDEALLKDRAQRLTHATVKLWKLVEKEDACVGKRHLARSERLPSPQHSGGLRPAFFVPVSPVSPGFSRRKIPSGTAWG